MDELALVQARWRLGIFPPEGLPAVARRALEDGEDGPALRALAELDAPTRSQAQSLFADALEEMGLRPLPLEEAGRVAAADLARRILSGELQPAEGARRIAWEVWDRVRELEELGVFVTLMEKHEARHEHREVIEEAIRRQAERLLRHD